jgi:rod shape-determining protein MreD
MKNLILVIILLFFVSGWEILISPAISIFEIAPELPVIILVFLGLYYGFYSMLLFGFLWGIISSALSPEIMGWNALIMVVIGYGINFIRTHFNWDSTFNQIAVTFFAVLVHDILYFPVSNFGEAGRILIIAGRYSLPTAVYSTIFAGLIYFLFGRHTSRARR